MAAGSRIIAQLFASTFSNIVMVVGQLVVVPVFIGRWTLAGYGEWVAISAIASYLSYSNLGIPGALRAYMAMSAGRDDDDAMIEAFQTALLLIGAMATLMLGAYCGLLFLFSPAKILHLQWMSANEGLWVCLCFGVQIALYAISSVFSAALSAVGQYAMTTTLTSMRQLAEFVLVCVCVGLFKAAPAAAVLIYPLSWIVLTLAFAVMLWRSKREVYHLPPRIRPHIIRELIRPMLGVLGMTLGYGGMTVQVPRIVLAMTAGPQATAIYALSSMLMRIVRIPIDIPAHSVSVEISLAVGKTDFATARKLVSGTTRFCLWLAVVSAPIVVLFGPWASFIWTAGRAHIPSTLVMIMTGSTLFFAIALPCQEALMAVGKLHQATKWLLVTAAPFVMICWLMARTLGANGAAASCLLLDSIYAISALVEVLRFFEIDFGAFLRSMATPPTDIALQQLRRLIPARA